ncbi:unnamed protein product [Oreochromis niloticus]|nr:unnamed protein product [Mustela putorius furo]
MSLLHEQLSECTLTELDLFTAPLTQFSIEDKCYSEILPVTALTYRGPLEFYVPGNRLHYLDLNDTLLSLRLKITNADGSDIDADTNVAIINYPLNTIFSQCDVTLGDRLISHASSTHPYRPIIETYLNYSEESLKTQFSAGLFYKDTAGAHDSHVVNNVPNREFCDRLLLNNVDLRVKLTRANDAFSLTAPQKANYRVNILGTSMFVRTLCTSHIRSHACQCIISDLTD